jgi:RNA polymerase sigma-70 factor (ECF subfamily)
MMRVETDFRTLMERFRQGDAAAARRLFEEYSPYVLRAVRRRLHGGLRSRYDSLDFTQDVWASFMATTHGQQFDGPEALITYLARMAHHKVIDVHREQFVTQKRSRQREQSLTESNPDRVPGPTPTPSQVLMADEREDRLRRLLRQLPPKYQRAIDLRHQGRTYDEIAAQVGLSERTVRRLLQKLFDRLEEL